MFIDEADHDNSVSLTLGELLRDKGDQQLVLSTDSARTAGKAIARGRKAVSYAAPLR